MSLFDTNQLRNLRVMAVISLAVASTLITGTASAFEDLTEAQKLIYQQAHLANTTDGQTISYLYTATQAGKQVVEDTATLSINRVGEKDLRDVVVDFLTEERHLALPPFDAWRGNPVIIAMLEHTAQSIGRETGGGALYFRNRIRDAMASTATSVEIDQQEWNGQDIEVTTLTFSPFTGDEYIKSNPKFLDTKFVIMLSEDVPGGLLELQLGADLSPELAFSKRIVIK